VLCLWLIPSHGWLGAAWASIASDGLAVLLFGSAVLFLAQGQSEIYDASSS
jgi:O-antigen/teichoic acid export membrane protein